MLELVDGLDTLEEFVLIDVRFNLCPSFIYGGLVFLFLHLLLNNFC